MKGSAFIFVVVAALLERVKYINILSVDNVNLIYSIKNYN